MSKKLGIGYCGAHRTGKTTTGKALSEKTGIPMSVTQTSKVFKELGFNPANNLVLSDRLLVQHATLDSATKMWDLFINPFITDRTPIDMIAYTLASVKQEELTPELDVQLQDYIRRCIMTTEKYFNVIFQINPVIPIVEEFGKAATWKTHIDHIALLVNGLTGSEHFYDVNIHVIPDTIVTIDERVEFCQKRILQ